MNHEHPATSPRWFVVQRPWWWWLNPWLYAMRRDRAYCDAIDSLREAASR